MNGSAASRRASPRGASAPSSHTRSPIAVPAVVVALQPTPRAQLGDQAVRRRQRHVGPRGRCRTAPAPGARGRTRRGRRAACRPPCGPGPPPGPGAGSEVEHQLRARRPGHADEHRVVGRLLVRRQQRVAVVDLAAQHRRLARAARPFPAGGQHRRRRSPRRPPGWTCPAALSASGRTSPARPRTRRPSRARPTAWARTVPGAAPRGASRHCAARRRPAAARGRSSRSRCPGAAGPGSRPGRSARPRPAGAASPGGRSASPASRGTPSSDGCARRSAAPTARRPRRPPRPSAGSG